MSTGLSPHDLERVRFGIHEKYKTVASDPDGHFSYPTGRKGLLGLNYAPELMRLLPDSVAASYCGVGNPLSLGDIQAGDRVLDVGCGAGVDALLAAALVGDTGSVMGIDLTPEMIDKAVANRQMMGAGNVDFRVADIGDLGSMENHFDVAISNGVFNLIPDKAAALNTVFRLLKPGGRLFVADQFLVGSAPKNLDERVATWFQ